MDKFIQRQRTWKTKTYDDVVAAAAQKNERRDKGDDGLVKRRPLEESQDLNLMRGSVKVAQVLQPKELQNCTTATTATSSSVTSEGDEHFVDVKSSLESVVIIKRNTAQHKHDGVEGLVAAKCLNTPITKICHMTPKLNGYAQAQQSNPTPRKNYQRGMTEQNLHDTKSSKQDNIKSGHQLVLNAENMSKQDPQKQRLQRDLNSPSASLRARALRALRTPDNTGYNTFDVPHYEQSIITTHEKNPPPIPTLAEVFKDIVIYVEVRTENDNRSEGVKTVIAKMGAQVNDRLLRNTTHVIFKDGLLSTYKKASSWNIPIVSILWIEACKVQRKLCDPEKFPISNLHLYEYPELYPKMARVRCIQPNSELNRRPRKLPTTKLTGTKSTPTIATESNSSSKLKTAVLTPNNDITHYFKSISSNKQIQAVSEGATFLESPATQLLNRISNGVYTPMRSKTKDANHREDSNIGQSAAKPVAMRSLSFNDTLSPDVTTQSKNNKRRSTLNTMSRSSSAYTQRHQSSIHAVNNSQRTTDKLSETVTSSTRGRRSSMQIASSETNSQSEIIQSVEPATKRRRSVADVQVSTTPFEPRMTRRRSSLQMTPNTNGNAVVPKTPSIQTIEEEDSIPDAVDKNITNCAEQSMEISVQQLAAMPKLNQCCTLYTTELMNISENISSSEGDNLCTLSRQILASSADTEHTSGPIFSSTRLPETTNGSSCNSRRTLYSVTMDLIKDHIDSINNKSKRRSMAQSEETFYTEFQEHEKQAPQAVDKPNLNQDGDSSGNSKPRMRQLFTPNDVGMFTPQKSAKKSRPSISSSSNISVAHRRRTLAPSKSMQDADSDINLNDNEIRKAVHLKTIGRRISSELAVQNQNDVDSKYTTSAREIFLSPTVSEEVVNAPTDNKPKAKRRRTIQTLVHTNMHNEQIRVIHKAVKKLKRMRIDPSVTSRTTHLVSLEPRRTLNLLRGLMRGVWVVSYSWILESLRVGKWVDEEHYELTVFSRAIPICRTERQAFGADYHCELFKTMGNFYVSSLCRPIQCNNMKELLLLGSAKLVENRYKAKYIIGDKRRAEDDRIYLSPYWVLDSISAMQIQKFQKYFMKSAIVTPVGIKYENPLQRRIVYKDPELVMDK